MEMKKAGAGKLRAIGYDPPAAACEGSAATSSNARACRRRPPSVHRRPVWSYFWENFEEEFSTWRLR